MRTIRCGTIREIANAALERVAAVSSRRSTPQASAALQSRRSGCCGRLLLQAFYGVRSERQIMERLEYRPAVPLVCWAWAWMIRPGTRPPLARTATGCWRATWRRGFLAAIVGSSQGQAAALPRALQRRWHADRGLGVDEELPAQGRLGTSRRRPGRNGERDFHGEAPLQRQPPEHHGPGLPPLPQGGGSRGQALLHGPRLDGEPQRPGGGRLPDPGHRPCGAGRRPAHDRAPRRPGDPRHARSRQGLRRARTSSTSCAR